MLGTKGLALIIADLMESRMSNHVRGRRSLLWLTVPFLLFVAALPLANRIDPVILGLPFLFFWALLA